MNTLNYILSKKFDETYTLSFIGTPQQVNEYGAVFKTPIIKGISSINSFSDDTSGENSNVFFTKMFKYKNGDNWSDTLPISNISGLTLSSCEDFQLELYYYRTVNGNYNDDLYINNITLNGNYVLSAYDSEAELKNQNDIVILRPTDTYKIFSLTDFNVYSAPHNSYEIKYRFTQDNYRTFTQWEPLTKENISTIKLNPIRFANIEYSIKNLSTQGLLIYDIILIGDFQNVSANYLKTNKYGLKQDCLTTLKNLNNNINNDFYSSCLGSYMSSTDPITDLNTSLSQNSSSLWNPYQTGKIVEFSNLLGNQMSAIAGWNVQYHLTDPDGNGIDTYLHEYTLKNIVDMKYIKIVVADNKFPTETMIINQFNLNLFDTFEVHIMKDAFKNAFGITRRPSEDDIIYICETNMLFQVKHSQSFRNVMNSSTYYKVILEKYENKTNIRNLSESSKSAIENLTENSTIDSLFGNDMIQEEEKNANKQQTYPTSFDKVRLKISPKVVIIKESNYIENFDTIKQYYDLSYPALKNKIAINYTKIDNNLKKSDNRSFINWFKFNNSYSPDIKPNNIMYNNYNIQTGAEYNLINNYSSGIGYKIYYQGDSLYFKLNDNLFKLNKKLETNIWYSSVINLNQRQNTLDMYLYRRDCETTITLFNSDFIKATTTGGTEYINLLNEGYRPVDNTEDIKNNGMILLDKVSYNIDTKEFTHTENLNILGSNIKTTNIRILDDIIPEKSIINILKEYIITDEQNLILADNATKTLVTKTYFNKNFR